MATLQDYLGITKLRDAWPKWKANVIAVNNQVINHVAGTADKHSAQDITYTGDFVGKTEVKAALDQAKTEIDTIVVNASIDPEVAFARISAVKSETFATLDARLEEGEQDLVSYKAETAAQMESISQVYASKFGIKSDGSDNAIQFQNLSDFVNTLTQKTEVIFPQGIFMYTSGLVFTRECKLKGTLGTVLNYTGVGIAVELGKIGVDSATFLTNQMYEVEGITFTGGSQMTAGIYFNRYVTMPRLLNCKFLEFGNPNAWGVFFDIDNWDVYIHGCTWFATNPVIGGLKWIGMSPYTNTRVRISDCMATCGPNTGKIAISLDGGNCVVDNCKIEGFETNIRLGGYASYSKIVNSYFEAQIFDTTGTEHHGCIEIGSEAGEVSANISPTHINIENCYANLHNDGTRHEHFIAPTKTTDTISFVGLKNINVSNLDFELIYQNDLPGQMGNSASGCSGYTLFKNLPTQSWNGLNGGVDLYKSNQDAEGYLTIQLGKTATQYSGFAINDFDGTRLHTIRATPAKGIQFMKNALVYLSVTPSGGAIFPNDVINNKSFIASKFMLSARNIIDASMLNGTIFEDSADSKLKYKKIDGTIVIIG